MSQIAQPQQMEKYATQYYNTMLSQMVGLRIEPRNQKQFNLLRILALALSIILDEKGLEEVREAYNALFTEYYMQISENNDRKIPGFWDLMEKYILKGDLPQTLSEWWYYFIIQDCILCANNYDTYIPSLNRKLDRNLIKLENLLASDMRNFVRNEVKEYAPNSYWICGGKDPCDECLERDGVRLADIKNLIVHPNCKCFVKIVY